MAHNRIIAQRVICLRLTDGGEIFAHRRHCLSVVAENLILNHCATVLPCINIITNSLMANKLGHGNTPDAPVRRNCDSISASVSIPVGCNGCFVVQPVIIGSVIIVLTT